MPDRSDLELIYSIIVGGSYALGVLYDRYSFLCNQIARKHLGNPFDIDEVVQDVFVSIWKNAKYCTFDSPDKVRAWLLQICRNTVTDKLRKNGKSSQHISYGGEKLIDELSESSQADLIINRIDLRMALNIPPPPQKLVIDMCYCEGHTHKEIAEMLELPEGTVKGRLRLALKKLRYILDPGGECS